jgi:hypothetical protein
MNSFILNNIPFTLDTAELAKYLKVDINSDDYELLEGLAEKARSIGKPKAIYKISSLELLDQENVLVDGVKLHSSVMRINTQKLSRVFPYVATCGGELEEWSETVEDILERYWVDHIKQVVLRSAIGYLKNHVQSTFEVKSLSAMNPGSLPDWPLNEQRNLFKILGNVYDEIGVRLSESYLMIPTKSVSGIYFQTETQYENCQLCPRSNCPNRRLPYDANLLNEKYKRS